MAEAAEVWEFDEGSIARVDAVVASALHDVERVTLATSADPEQQKRLIRLLSDADKLLGKRLHAWNAANGGGDLRFTAASLVSYQSQIRAMLPYAQEQIAGFTGKHVATGWQAGLAHAQKQLFDLDKAFTGIGRAPRLRQAIRFDSSNGKARSILRSMKTSVDRYGTAMIWHFENTMAVGLVAGLSQYEMVQLLTGQAGPKGDVSIRAKIVGGKVVRTQTENIPEGLFVRYKSWPWRIVRTEIANAYNGAKIESLRAFKQEIPNLKKKILAHFDIRTADDSVAVHGQVRDLDGQNVYFQDGAGRVYEHPPARPHDRETVIPWIPDEWEEVPSTAPLSADQVATANHAIAKGRAPFDPAKRREEDLAVEQARTGQLAGQLTERLNLNTPELPPGHTMGASAGGSGYVDVFNPAGTKVTYFKGDLANPGAGFTVSPPASIATQFPTKVFQAAEEAAVYGIRVSEALAAEKAAMVAAQEAAKQAAAQAAAEAAAKAAAEQAAKQAAKLHQIKVAEATALAEEIEAAHAAGKPFAHMIANLDAYGAEVVAEAEANLLAAKVHAKAVAEAEVLAKQIKALASAPVVDSAALAAATQEVTALNAAYPGAFAQAMANIKAQETAAAAVQAAADAKKAKAAATRARNKAAKARAAAIARGEIAPATVVDGSTYARKRGYELVDFAEDPTIRLSHPGVRSASGVAVPMDGDQFENQEVRFRLMRDEHGREFFHVSTMLRDEVGDAAFRVFAPSAAGDHVWWASNIVEGGFNSQLQLKRPSGYGDTLNRTRTAVNTRRHGRQHVADDGTSVVSAISRDPRVRGSSRTYENPMGRGRHNEGGIASQHNRFEMRIYSSNPTVALREFERETTRMGLSNPLARPDEGAVQAQIRARILARYNEEGATALTALEARTPEAIGALWDKQVARFPRLASFESSTSAVYVGNGAIGYYSDEMIKMVEEAGITHLVHDSGLGGADLHRFFEGVGKMPGDSMLLATSERWDRGMNYAGGQSSDTDTGTGGAFGVFTRLRTGTPSAYGLQFEIDTGEAGRLDSIFANDDTYGRSDRRFRTHIADLREKVRNSQLNGVNEFMPRHSIPTAGVRTVRVPRSERQPLIDHLRKQGITTLGGRPVEDVIQ